METPIVIKPLDITVSMVVFIVSAVLLALVALVENLHWDFDRIKSFFEICYGMAWRAFVFMILGRAFMKTIKNWK